MRNTKASLVAADGSKELKFRFNPKEYSISKSATWNRPTNKSAKSSTKPEFGGVQPQSLSMELFFDDWENPNADLLDDVKTLLGWLKPTEESVSVKYTMFKPDGKPVRATANIALEEVPDEPKATNPTSGSLAGRRTYVLAAGDSLHSVAYAEYGDPGLWRALAVFNAIDDPLRIAPGIRLLLPSADEATAVVG